MSVRRSHRRTPRRTAAPMALGGAVAVALAAALPAAASAPSTPFTSSTGRTAAAAAVTCTTPAGDPATCPTITSVSVTGQWVRSARSPAVVSIPVTVVLDDPDGIATEVDTHLGRNLEQSQDRWLVTGYGIDSEAAAGSGTQKTFSMTVRSPERPLLPEGSPPVYGTMQVNPVVWGLEPGGDPTTPTQFLAETYRSGNLMAQTFSTIRSSTTAARAGVPFTVSGTLKRFDGRPLARATVRVVRITSGSNRQSLAGRVTTSSTGTWSLSVRQWSSSSWYVFFDGSTSDTRSYKGVHVR